MVEIIESTKFYSGERILRVINSGFYNECDLVEVCYDEDESNFPIGAAQAHYIVYGYHFDEPQIETPPENLIDPNEGE
jgi:hypothetical protein